MDITLLRKQAEARYAQEGMPSIQDESWRFTDVSQLNPALFTASWKARCTCGHTFKCVLYRSGKWTPVSRKIKLGQLAKGGSCASYYGLYR